MNLSTGGNNTSFYNNVDPQLASSKPTSDPQTDRRVRNLPLAYVEIIIQSLIFIMAVVGNMAALVLLQRSRHVTGTSGRRDKNNCSNSEKEDGRMEEVEKKEERMMRKTKTRRRKLKRLSRMNYMMMHLTVADLFVAFFNVLPQLIWDVTEKFKGNDVICRSVTYLQLVAMFASSYVLVATGLDRHSAICRPLTSITWSSKRAWKLIKFGFLFLRCSMSCYSVVVRSKILISIAWLLSFVFSLPQVIIFSFRMDSFGFMNCWAVFDPPWTLRIYVVWIAMSIYAIPVVILLVTYTLLCRAVWSSFQAGLESETVVRPERKKFSLTSITSSFRTNSTMMSSLLRTRKPFLRNHFKTKATEQPEKFEKRNGIEMEIIIPFGDLNPLHHEGNPDIDLLHHDRLLADGQNNEAKDGNKQTGFIGNVVTFNLPNDNFKSEAENDQFFKNTNKSPNNFHGNVLSEAENRIHFDAMRFERPQNYLQNVFRENFKNKNDQSFEKEDVGVAPEVKNVLHAKESQQHKGGIPISKKKSQMSRAKIRTVKLTVVINISYILCWCPFFFSQVWAALDSGAPYESPGMTITTLLASLNSCMNPLIFIFFVHTQRSKKRTK